MSTLLAVISIYLFIFIGFIAKKVFQDDIHEKTLILISLYFLQPMLTFWGLTRTPIDFNLVLTPFLYFIIVTIVLVILIFRNINITKTIVTIIKYKNGVRTKLKSIGVLVSPQKVNIGCKKYKEIRIKVFS